MAAATTPRAMTAVEIAVIQSGTVAAATMKAKLMEKRLLVPELLVPAQALFVRECDRDDCACLLTMTMGSKTSRIYIS